MSFAEIMINPDRLLVQEETGWAAMRNTVGATWVLKDVEVSAEKSGGGLEITLRAERTAVLRLTLLWNRETVPGARLMCDHWERGYGDLEWRGIVPERVMPWYFMLSDGKRTHGYGVKTGPKAMCFWQVSENSIMLCLDVRCGGMGVVLGGRNFHAATVVSREGHGEESAFKAAGEFCRLMCDAPLMPPQPVYGGNNWYYAYGKSSHGQIVEDARFITELAPAGGNRPFMVIDEGWALPRSANSASLWRQGNGFFPDMHALACQMKNAGARPGIWVRPLSAPDSAMETLCLPPERFKFPYKGRYLDPSIPEVLEGVIADIKMQADWGYELIKHDYTTFDILGRWGFEMGGELTNEGWRFSDQSRTTAEIMLQLYRVIRQAAGSALIIGCNTVGHIAAGIFEMQRTGDDTSGRQWERTRKMGINTLAFCMPKHGAFYASDADCAGITPDVPWELNRQWLHLLARSGTPLFVSAQPAGTGPEQKRAIREAFAAAAREIPPAEPLDWMDTTCPRRWVLAGEEVEFNWQSQDRVEFCK